MEQICRGEKEAFDAMFLAYAPGLCGYLTRYVGCREMAEDIVQDVFFTIWSRRTEIRITGSVSSYLLRAAKNRALDAIRHDKVVNRFAAGVVASSDDYPGSAESELLALLEVQEAISRLPARRRLIFTMSRQQGMTYAEIAESLGLSIKTVEAQIGLALRSLRAARE